MSGRGGPRRRRGVLRHPFDRDDLGVRDTIDGIRWPFGQATLGTLTFAVGVLGLAGIALFALIPLMRWVRDRDASVVLAEQPEKREPSAG
ncbi:hypothetical protein ACTOB_003180 [Actinoplanes oblitus]|uniref:Uncharacterized protein n=1 Tax=Actinoplanes oblitus TaxID=3040509 RepID=A0ABY8WRU3_9ACTN|nr:hypothetical protein [Actinoplanes oblitus]WIM99522.1 hypothetical protein ACTOB_003180 [Actinoplanes oblitus]